MNALIYISIIACTTYIGFGLAAYYSRRERLYGDLCMLCGNLKSDIGFLLLPLEEILQRARDYCGALALLFLDETDRLIKSGEIVTAIALEDGVKTGGHLSAEEKQFICNFFAALGKSDCRTQIGVIEGYVHRFDELRIKCGAEKKKSSPLCKKLGFMGGLIICLFLL